MIERHELFNEIPKELIDKVFEYDKCEFDIEFLGFTEYYKALATIIKKGMTVIDFGCNQAVQSWYFREHCSYIGIDVAIPVEYRLKTNNSLHYQEGISHWIEFEFPKLNINERNCFAICNYVPDWGAQAIVKQRFQNVFNFYP